MLLKGEAVFNLTNKNSGYSNLLFFLYVQMFSSMWCRSSNGYWNWIIIKAGFYYRCTPILVHVASKTNVLLHSLGPDFFFTPLYFTPFVRRDFFFFLLLDEISVPTALCKFPEHFVCLYNVHVSFVVYSFCLMKRTMFLNPCPLFPFTYLSLPF